MIKLPLDEGYSFDFLSILEVKSRKITGEKTREHFNQCESEIKSQIGNGFYQEIISSKEYSDLIDANWRLFEVIEMLRAGGPVTAKEIDDLNSERFIYKKNLQMKFFHSEAKETKTINENSFRK